MWQVWRRIIDETRPEMNDGGRRFVGHCRPFLFFFAREMCLSAEYKENNNNNSKKEEPTTPPPFYGRNTQTALICEQATKATTKDDRRKENVNVHISISDD